MSLLMDIKRDSYPNPLEALLALNRSLLSFEQRHDMTSSQFYERYRAGQLGDERDFVEWAGDYKHYSSLKEELENRLEVTT